MRPTARCAPPPPRAQPRAPTRHCMHTAHAPRPRAAHARARRSQRRLHPPSSARPSLPLGGRRGGDSRAGRRGRRSRCPFLPPSVPPSPPLSSPTSRPRPRPSLVALAAASPPRLPPPPGPPRTPLPPPNRHRTAAFGRHRRQRRRPHSATVTVAAVAAAAEPVGGAWEGGRARWEGRGSGGGSGGRFDSIWPATFFFGLFVYVFESIFAIAFVRSSWAVLERPKVSLIFKE